MKNFNNNKGSVLLVVLVLSAVALVISAGLMYMVTEGTKSSGASKRYKSALEAARACADMTINYIETKPKPSDVFSPSSYVTFGIVNPVRLADADTGKLYAANANWGGSNDDISIDTSDSLTYDITCTFGTYPYKSYVKVSGTRPGNSGGAGSRLHGGGTTDAKWAGGGAGSIPVTSYPYLYSIEVLAVNENNPLERARLSVLYQY